MWVNPTNGRCGKEEVIERVRKIPKGKGLGVLYWEPEVEFVGVNINLSALGSGGKLSKVLDAFIN